MHNGFFSIFAYLCKTVDESQSPRNCNSCKSHNVKILPMPRYDQYKAITDTKIQMYLEVFSFLEMQSA